MNKNQIIASLVEMVRRGEISQSEIMQAYRIGSGTPAVVGEVLPQQKTSKGSQVTISQVLSFIGALVVCIGIIVLVFQYWDDFTSLIRIFITLGTAAAAYTVAVLFERYPSLKITSLVIFGISMILLPVGIMVTLNELSSGNDALIAQIITSLISFIVAIASFVLYRKNLFVAFSIAFGTWFYYVLVIQLLDSSSILSFNDFNIYAYMTIAAGLSHILLGYTFSKSESGRAALTNFLYKVGLFAVLAAALSMGGIWDFLYIFVVFGAILLSVFLKSKTFLWLGGVFLMAYIIKMIGVHFYQDLGWPLSLVLAGICLIVIGYVTNYIGRKYITKNESLRP